VIERRIGASGPVVSAVGLGCLGMTEDFYGPADEAESVAVIHRALELGVNHFDTADMYGPYLNEELLGRALRGRRDQAVVATKFGLTRDEAGNWTGTDGRPSRMREACEGSLQRLGTDHIDLYFQHRLDPAVPVEETVGAMSELVEGGKVRFLGLCEVSAQTLRRAHAVHPIAAVQSEYSLFSREVEAVLPAMRELGVGLVAYSPLGRGLLGGAISGGHEITGWRRENPRFGPGNIDHNLELVERLRTLAAEREVTSAQLALAWVLAQGDDVVAIPGTKRRRNLEANVAAADIVLAPEDLHGLESVLPADAVAGDRSADMSEFDV
jgi:aryl-alcohol dehydrogenase-like predicted oxidoreductase